MDRWRRIRDFLTGKLVRPQSAQPTVHLEFNDASLSVQHRDGQLERIHWRELETIEIRTTGEGPWSEDLFWMFTATRSENSVHVVIPNEGMSPALLEFLQQTLPGFDNQAVIRASACVEDALFTIWTASKKVGRQ